VLYPGKLAQAETFRIGCIGAIEADEMRQAVHAIADALRKWGSRSLASPRKAAALPLAAGRA
jgi:2-aminoethylphosphonate-pyruvate transaminase